MHIAFDAGSIHCEGKWEGVAPRKSRLFWALLNGIEPSVLSVIWVQKESRFPGRTALPLALVMDAARIKSSMHGPYKSLVNMWFYVQEPTDGFSAHTTPPVRLSNITALVLLRNITALLFPPSPPPHPELIINQQETVRCIMKRSGT